MPCYMTGSAAGDAALAHQEEKEALTKELTRLTRLLCLACKHMDKTEQGKPKDVDTWWKKHQAVDKHADLPKYY